MKKLLSLLLLSTISSVNVFSSDESVKILKEITLINEKPKKYKTKKPKTCTLSWMASSTTGASILQSFTYICNDCTTNSEACDKATDVMNFIVFGSIFY